MSLEHFLQINKLFESEEESAHRKYVLEQLLYIFNEWVLSLSSTKVGQSGPPLGKLLTLGSYELGIHGPGADIDVLFLVPSPITRTQCFNNFYPLLQSKLGNQIESLRKIEQTYVPVIKLTYLGIDLDIAFACWAEGLMQPQNLMNDASLNGLDIHSVRSLNGYRDCRYVQQLVGSRTETFKMALRALKFWAYRRAIYNNSVGYFSGMALTVLLAKITVEIPDTRRISASSILKLFFEKYHNWRWPERVSLCRIEANNSDAPLLKVWNPYEYSFDKLDRMPILTPCYPHRNSAYTASISTRRVILQELKRGHLFFNGNNSKDLIWEDFFEPQNFFRRKDFSSYVVLSAMSTMEATETLSHWDWCAIVRSRIREIVSEIEFDDQIKLIYVCPNSYPHPECQPGNFHSLWFIGIIFNLCGTGEFNFDEHINAFVKNAFSYAKDHGVDVNGRSTSGIAVPAKDIQAYMHPGIGYGLKGWTSLQEVRKGHFYSKTSLEKF